MWIQVRRRDRMKEASPVKAGGNVDLDEPRLQSRIKEDVKSKEFIEGFKDYPIYSTIGNHDAYPQDLVKAEKGMNKAIQKWSPLWDPIFKT